MEIIKNPITINQINTMPKNIGVLSLILQFEKKFYAKTTR